MWAGKAAEAARAAGDRTQLSRALVRMAHALWLRGDYAEAAAHARESFEIAEAIGNLSIAVGARMRYLISQRPWEPSRAKDLAAVVALADQAGLTTQQVGGRWSLATRQWEQGADIESTLRINTEALEISRRSGYLFGEAWSLSNMAEDLIDRGDWGRAEAVAAESVATYERIGASFGADYPRIYMAWLRGLRGDPSGAMQSLREQLASAIAARDAQTQRGTIGFLADLYLASGQPAAALTLLDEASQTLGLAPDDRTYLFSFGVRRADALCSVERMIEARTCVDAALQLIEAGENWRFAWVGRGIRGKILASSGDWEEASRDYTFAEQSLRASWRPLFLARVLRDWGTALSRRETAEAIEEAGRRLTEALTIFENLGARLDADHTRRLLE